jgi:hypothetical protein
VAPVVAGEPVPDTVAEPDQAARRPGTDEKRKAHDTTGPTTGPTAPDPTSDSHSGAADSSAPELLRMLTENVRSIVAQELSGARAEMTEKALAARPAAAMLGGAAVLGALATGTSAAALLRARLAHRSLHGGCSY